MHQDIHQHLSEIATAIADSSRAKILCYLMDGRAYTATELSLVADISPSTTSVHLNKLVKQDLIQMIQQGRHRYFCLKNEDVAKLLEMLMAFPQQEKKSIKSSTPKQLQVSRSCYNHLAGSVAVQIHAFMLKEQWLMGKDNYVLTNIGIEKLKHMGLNLDAINIKSEKTAYFCLDWSERKPHLGGQLASLLFIFFEQKKWLQRYPQTREVIWSTQGKLALKQFFNINYEDF